MKDGFLKALLFALLVLVMPAHALVTISNVSSSYTVASADDEKFIAVDATSGNLTITIPAISTLPAGWRATFYKVDPTSNLVGFSVSTSGDKLNYFWTNSAPYPLWMNLTQQAVEIVCDGVSRCHMMGKTFHRNVPQSQRTFVSTTSLQSFSVRPQDVNEIIEINAAQADMGVYFDPVGHFTRGGYLSGVLEFVRMDDSAHSATIFAASGESINGAASVSLSGLYTHLRCYIDSARITCR